MENHFGLLEIDWDAAEPTLNMKIIDVSGKTRINRTISFKDLQMPVQ